MPWCTYCGQAFTRDEHLERHILTHTNVKPYKCPSCFMSFARRDLLQRHYLVHGRNPDQNPDGSTSYSGMLPRSAGRTPIACHNCAKTKTKCDKKFPCSRCASRNLTCTARPTRRTTKSMRASEQMVPAGSTASPPSKAVPTPPPSGSSSNGCPSPGFTEKHVPVGSINGRSHGSDVSEEHDGVPYSSLEIEIPSDPQESVSPPNTMPESSCLQEDMSRLACADVLHNADLNLTNGSGFHPTEFSNAPDWSQIDPSTYSTETFQFGEDQGQDVLFSWPENLDMNSLSQMPYDHQSTGAFWQFPSSQTTNACTMPTRPLNLETSCQFRQILPNNMNLLQSQLKDDFYSAPGYQFNTNGLQSLPTTPHECNETAISQDSWPAFRCMPITPPHAAPKTAQPSIERLRRGLQNPRAWENFRPSNWHSEPRFLDGPLLVINVEPPKEAARGRLETYMQASLLRAIHSNGECTMCNYETGLVTPGSELTPQTGPHYRSRSMPSLSACSSHLNLPPSHVINELLHSYACNFEQFFPLTGQGSLSADDLILSGRTDSDSSCLLTLLMVTQGAKVSTSIDARWLVQGLVEVCRLGLSDLIEKDVMKANEIEVLHSALLVTCMAAWSGDKWQMDIAAGQGKMWLTRLRQSGFIECFQQSTGSRLRLNEIAPSTESLWEDWTRRENHNRIVYSWAMLDQDTSLFHDVSPLFSVREFGASLPHPDSLWHAKTAREWAALCERRRESPGVSISGDSWPLSLRDLFSQFLNDGLALRGPELSALQLRLLLHPLQALVFQYRQLLSCFSSSPSSSRPTIGSNSMADATHRHFDEVRMLLQRWYSLADRHLRTTPTCPMMQSALVVFHLVSLNAITNIPEIEALARRGSSMQSATADANPFSAVNSGSHWNRQSLLRGQTQCIADVEEAIFHAGQVLRLVRGMSYGMRPPWWAGAVYRAALVLWCDALTHASEDAFVASLDPSLFMATSAPMAGDMSMSIDFDSMYGSGSNSAGMGMGVGMGGSTSTANACLRPCEPLPTSTAHAAFFAIDSLAPDHPLIVKYLTRREGVPMLTRCDGSQIRIDNAYAVLCHCIDVLDEAGVGDAFVEGIKGKLARLAKAGLGG